MSGVWSDIHKDNYANSDWIDKPSLFAQTAISYFPEDAYILELGAGQGQDSRYFAEHGFTVLSSDLEEKAIDLGKTKLPERLANKVMLQQIDINNTLPFGDCTFDVVYAHLSLHYFNTKKTKEIFSEISRVLKPHGLIAFFTNSTTDPEYGSGKQIEPDFFLIDEMKKRYFTPNSAKQFARDFDPILTDAQGETYKDSAKGVHNLIRFIGRKAQ